MPVRANIGTALVVAVLLIASFAWSEQSPQHDSFAIHVTKIRRINEGCAVEAESPKIRFKLSSQVSASCAMLRAGEKYSAFRVTLGNDPKDEAKDTASLVINNNMKNDRRPNALFNIDSEEAIPQK